MPTIQCEIEVELPTLDPKELTRGCHDYEYKYYNNNCHMSWYPLKCLLPVRCCSDVTVKTWKNFLKDKKIIEGE